jgi:hypothetical protein
MNLKKLVVVIGFLLVAVHGLSAGQVWSTVKLMTCMDSTKYPLSHVDKKLWKFHMEKVNSDTCYWQATLQTESRVLQSNLSSKGLAVLTEEPDEVVYDYFLYNIRGGDPTKFNRLELDVTFPRSGRPLFYEENEIFGARVDRVLIECGVSSEGIQEVWKQEYNALVDPATIDVPFKPPWSVEGRGFVVRIYAYLHYEVVLVLKFVVDKQ